MSTILVILVFLALELFLGKRRRENMTLEIEEALGSRDSLIESLKREITDKFDACEFKAKQARADANRAADTVEEMIAEGKKPVITLDVDNTNSIVLLAQTVETLGKQCALLRQQSNSNNKIGQGLRRDVNHILREVAKNPSERRLKPPLGKAPTPPPNETLRDTPPPPTTSHCYDGPQDS